ncbi:aldehyde dehydrogenase family protein [Flavobacteriales bacterium]|nr:aldehyde dehydrogenase family protein [Flavobacteriales bacterium]
MSSKIKSLKYNGKWDFSPSIESIENLSIQKEYQLFINGQFQQPLAKKYFPSINPSNEQQLSRIAKAEAEDVDMAVKSARAAFNGQWGKISGKERAKYIYRIARIIQEKSKELAIVETLDGGKPIRESRDIDIPLAAAHFFYYAGWADKLEYAFPNRFPKPLGVVGQIIPWNFPLMMAAWKIAPALATGNTVVLKPAESTSITALLLAEIIKEAELPSGVVNIITGDGSTGNLIVNHPDVNKIAFTGSTQVGKSIMQCISGTNKRSTMELGGKAANIIFEDAPLDQAVEGVINGIYFNQGHVCCAGSRLFIQESVYDVVLRKLKDRMQSLVVGNPLDKNTDIGAVNSKQQLATIQKYIDIGVKEGADIFQLNCELPKSGYWCPPTLFTNVSQSHSIAKEEIFGPVLAVQTFRTTQEVINKANNTPYGLSAGVWTDKGSKAFNLASKLKAGVIWANTYNKFDPTSPFGGYKESGHGREGGLHGLSPYLNLE